MMIDDAMVERASRGTAALDAQFVQDCHHGFMLAAVRLALIFFGIVSFIAVGYLEGFTP